MKVKFTNKFSRYYKSRRLYYRPDRTSPKVTDTIERKFFLYCFKEMNEGKIVFNRLKYNRNSEKRFDKEIDYLNKED